METPVEPILARHRFEPRRRTLTVVRKAYLTPHMIRLDLTGDALSDFASLAPDDHVKLFIETGGEKPVMRDYTPRRFDPVAQVLTIDFALHDSGPATQWALDVAEGDTAVVGGPRGSAVVCAPFEWWLLIGDETALPAIGRWIEEMPAGAPVVSLVAVTDAADEQRFATQARHTAHWVHRPVDTAHEAAPLLGAVRALTLPAGRGFIWIGAEATVARALRDHLTFDRAHPREWIKAAGYWIKGQADASDKSLE